MDKVTFTINTSADILAAWLHTNWRAPVSATEEETLHGGNLVEIHRGGGARVLTADVIRVVEEANEEEGTFTELSQVSRDSFRFFLQPLDAHRVEVTVEGRFWLALLEALVSLLETMAMPGRWPELRHSLDYSLDGWAPFDEGARAALDAFEARLGRLQAGPAVTLAPALGASVTAGGESTEAGPDAERLEYLREHYLKMTDGEMAAELSITADWVKKLRLRHGIHKRIGRKGIPKQSP